MVVFDASYDDLVTFLNKVALRSNKSIIEFVELVDEERLIVRWENDSRVSYFSFYLMEGVLVFESLYELDNTINRRELLNILRETIEGGCDRIYFNKIEALTIFSRVCFRYGISEDTIIFSILRFLSCLDIIEKTLEELDINFKSYENIRYHISHKISC